MSIAGINSEIELTDEALRQALNNYITLNLCVVNPYDVEVINGPMGGTIVNILTKPAMNGLLIVASIAPKKYYLLHEDSVAEF